jgi:Flp pilus assembly protein TadD
LGRADVKSFFVPRFPPTQTRRLLGAASSLLVLAFVAGGCAHRLETRPPDGLDYAFPEWAPGELSPAEGEQLQEAWSAVLAGDVAFAEKRLRALLSRRPGQPSVQTALAYAALRGGRWAEAEAGFAAVLGVRPSYVPALVGAGGVAARSGDAERALALYLRAAEAAPRDRMVERRVQETRAQVLERRMADAREALAAGDLTAAEAAYRGALEIAPGVAGVRAELARLLQGAGRGDEAVTLLESAPDTNREVLEALARLQVERGQLEAALGVFRRLLSLDPEDPGLRERAGDVRRELELQRMPEEYQHIPTAERISRADLAALIAIKVTALSRLPPGETPVVVDVGERWEWARPWILAVVGRDILSLYPNHTFQPQATIRRDELAHAVGRVLDLLGWPEQAVPRLKDVSPSHLYYRGVTRSVGAGLLDVTPAGAFEGWRPVPGQDAVAVIEALASLVGP